MCRLRTRAPLPPNPHTVICTHQCPPCKREQSRSIPIRRRATLQTPHATSWTSSQHTTVLSARSRAPAQPSEQKMPTCQSCRLATCCRPHRLICASVGRPPQTAGLVVAFPTAPCARLPLFFFLLSGISGNVGVSGPDLFVKEGTPRLLNDIVVTSRTVLWMPREPYSCSEM